MNYPNWQEVSRVSFTSKAPLAAGYIESLGIWIDYDFGLISIHNVYVALNLIFDAAMIEEKGY